MKVKIKMNTADANCFSKHLLIFFQIHKKKLQTIWKCTDSLTISIVSVQRRPLCPRLNGLQLCTILEKNDHVFERLCEILSKINTRLANRKQKKTSLLHIVFKIVVDFFSNFLKKNVSFSQNIQIHMEFPLSFCSNQRCVRSKTGCHCERF